MLKSYTTSAQLLFLVSMPVIVQTFGAIPKHHRTSVCSSTCTVVTTMPFFKFAPLDARLQELSDRNQNEHFGLVFSVHDQQVDSNFFSLRSFDSACSDKRVDFGSKINRVCCCCTYPLKGFVSLCYEGLENVWQLLFRTHFTLRTGQDKTWDESISETADPAISTRYECVHWIVALQFIRFPNAAHI